MSKNAKQEVSKKWDRVQHTGSVSLWNYTLSPGWNDEEVEILKKALQLFGIGRWRQIINSNCLPGKTIGQIYMQTQRLIGQQSLGDFMGLQVNLEKIYMDNIKKTGCLRKNNSIINTGDNPTKEQRKKNIELNRQKYGLSQDIIDKITIPRYKSKLLYQYLSIEELESKKYTTLEILKNFDFVHKLLQKKIERVDEMQEEYDPRRKININLQQVNSINNSSNNNKKKAQYSLSNIEYTYDGEVEYKDPQVITLKRVSNKKMKIVDSSSDSE